MEMGMRKQKGWACEKKKTALYTPAVSVSFLHCGLLAQCLCYGCTFSQQFKVFRASHLFSHLEFPDRTPWSRYRGMVGFNSSVFQMWAWESKMWSGLLAGDKADALSQGAHALPIGVRLIAFTSLTMHTPLHATGRVWAISSKVLLIYISLADIYWVFTIICLVCW